MFIFNYVTFRYHIPIAMKPKPLLIIACFVLLSAFKSDNLPASFIDLLTRAQLTFMPPAGLIEVEPVKNSQMLYQYALKFPDKNFEVRYTVRPLDSIVNQYNDWLKNKKAGSARIDPNKMHATVFYAIMMNISDGSRPPQIRAFDSVAVKKEFNADWGATGVCVPGGDFAKGYKYCEVVTIHKNNVGDAYCFYLSDDVSYYQSLLIPMFHTMRFN